MFTSFYKNEFCDLARYEYCFETKTPFTLQLCWILRNRSSKWSIQSVPFVAASKWDPSPTTQLTRLVKVWPSLGYY